jgi:hypothetical protein
LETLGSVINKLKWEIKKFNQETANQYKEYRTKLIEVFKAHSIITIVRAEIPQLADTAEDKEV